MDESRSLHGGKSGAQGGPVDLDRPHVAGVVRIDVHLNLYFSSQPLLRVSGGLTAHMSTALRVLLGALAGALVGAAFAFVGGTPRATALERAAALVPDAAHAGPIGEFDPPAWYGAIYTIDQPFSGGAEDREALVDVFARHLAAEGWATTDTEEAPGATLMHANRGDLEVLAHLYGPPSSPEVRGLLQVRYGPPNPAAPILLGAAIGGVVGGGVGFISRSRSR